MGEFGEIVVTLLLALSIAAADGGSSITCEPVQVPGVKQTHVARQCAWLTTGSQFPLGGAAIVVWPSEEVDKLAKRVRTGTRIEAY